MKPKLPTNSNDFLDPKNEARLKDRAILLPIVKYVIPTFLIATSLLTAVYVTMLFLDFNEHTDEIITTCNIQSSHRINCLPASEAVYEKCINAECCWEESSKLCYHTLPSMHSYDVVAKDNYYALTPKKEKSPLGSNNKPVFAMIDKTHNGHIQIKLITSEPPVKTNSTAKENERVELENTRSNSPAKNSTQRTPIEKDLTTVNIGNSTFVVTVTRTNGSAEVFPILSTAEGPLIITENYWEWSLLLGNSNTTLYGLNSGELNGSLNSIYNNGDTSVKPWIIAITSNSWIIGCYIDFKGPMEIEVLKSNRIILRGLTWPAELSIGIFMGETPQEVTKGFLSLSTEQQSSMPSMLSTLGLHICPDEASEQPLLDLASTIVTMKGFEAPWDSYCVHRKFRSTLDKKMSTNDADLLKKMQTVLNDTGRVVFHHVSSACSYGKNDFFRQLADASLLLENNWQPYVGSIDGESFVYPEWQSQQTRDIYDDVIKEYLDDLSTPKGLFVRDAWPRDDSNYTTDFDGFDYVPKELKALMSRGTVPIRLHSTITSSHYKYHNDYAEKFNAFVGKYGYSIDVQESNAKLISSWAALKRALVRAISSGPLGQLPPAIYACNVTTVDEGNLCSRWYGVAVAFPHILAKPQNTPGGSWLDSSTSKYTARLLKLRTSFTTYQHSNMMAYFGEGSPLLTPTYYHFHREPATKYTPDQFMWGDSVLVGVVTLPNTFQLHMAIPGGQPWRHIQGGLKVHPNENERVPISVLEGEIITLLRPGRIIPFHEDIGATSTTTSRGSFKLICNLEFINDKWTAEGKIFYHPTVYIQINVNDTEIRLTTVNTTGSYECNIQETVSITTLEILGGSNNTIDFGTKPVCDVDYRAEIIAQNVN